MTLSCSQDLNIPPVRGEFVQDVFELKGYGQLPYNILFPEDYDGRQEYPLIMFLHGAGERGLDNRAQLKHVAPILTSTENLKKYPAILVFPQCPVNDYWANVDRSDQKWNIGSSDRPTASGLKAEKLLENIIANYTVNEKRVYLNGLSMGGFGTYTMLARHPEKIAAAIAICGGGDPKQAAKYKSVPLKIFHGAEDAVVPVSLSRNIAAKLESLKAPFSYQEYPSLGHDIWDNVYKDPITLEWLFAQTKP